MMISNNVPIFNFKEINAYLKILFYRSKICTTLQKQTHMGNSPHDSHQFYFERYLRDKLTDSEKSQLEERLANDIELNQAFEQYKSNRKSLLKELITEHDSGPKRSRLANIFYLTITIVGIAVATNYYLENRSLKEEINRDKKLIKRLVSYIPFVGKKIIKDSNEFVSTRTQTNTINENKTLNIKKIYNDSSLTEKENLDMLLFDTILIPIKRSYYEEKLAFYLNNLDSTLLATEVQQLVYKNSYKYDIKHKSSPISLSIWNSIEYGNTYRFDGNNLIITGLKPPYQLLLLKDEGELIWIEAEREIILLADNQIHNY
jgi:hypothetical protein